MCRFCEECNPYLFRNGALTALTEAIRVARDAGMVAVMLTHYDAERIARLLVAAAQDTARLDWLDDECPNIDFATTPQSGPWIRVAMNETIRSAIDTAKLDRHTDDEPYDKGLPQ